MFNFSTIGEIFTLLEDIPGMIGPARAVIAAAEKGTFDESDAIALLQKVAQTLKDLGMVTTTTTTSITNIVGQSPVVDLSALSGAGN